MESGQTVQVGQRNFSFADLEGNVEMPIENLDVLGIELEGIP